MKHQPTHQVMAMAEGIPKLTIRIPPRIGVSDTQQSVSHVRSTPIGVHILDPQQKELHSGTKNGILEFTIEGDRVSPGHVSNSPTNFYMYMRFELTTGWSYSGVAIAEMAEQ